MRKLRYFIAIMAVSLLSVGLLSRQQVSAAGSGLNWCAVLQGGQGSCPGGLYPDGSPILDHLANKSSSSALKTSLVALINQLAAGGNEEQRVGAAYVKAHLGGSDWVNRLNNPAVVAVINDNFNTDVTPTNTAYDPNSKSVIQYNFPQGTVKTLDLHLSSPSGPLLYVIKWDCGNPLGNYNGPPPYAPNSWALDGVTAVSGGAWTVGGSTSFNNKVTKVSGNSTPTYSYWVRAAWSNSNLTGQTNGGTWTAIASNSSQHNDYNANNSVVGPASHVNDWYCEYIEYSPPSSATGGSDYSKIDCKLLSAAPNTPPTGNFTSVTCNAAGVFTFRANFDDADGNPGAYLATAAGNRFSGVDTSSPLVYSSGSIAKSAWPVRLYVQDVGGSGYKVVDTTGEPNCPPSGNLTLGCNADGTGSAKASSVNDPNGATNSYVMYNGASSGRQNEPNGSWTIPVSYASAGNWSVTLRVRDINTGGDATVDSASHATCNRPPVVSLDASNCSQVTGWAFDPNNTAKSLVVYYYIYDSPASPTPIDTKVGVTDQLRLDVNKLYNPLDKTSKHGFKQTDVSALSSTRTDWGIAYIQVAVQDANDATLRHDVGARTRIGPCASVSCATTTFGNLTIDQDNHFTVSSKITGSNTPPPSGNTFVITVTGPNGRTFNSGGTPASSAADPWIVTSADQIFRPSTAGTYAVSWTYGGKACGGNPVKVGFKPYFSVKGGDVSAGAGYGAACTQDATAGIKSWNNNDANSAGYFGAGTQLGAFALGVLTGFQTGQGGVDNAPSSGLGADPTTLSFANTTASNSPSTGSFGGGYGIIPCASDYVGTAVSNSSAQAKPDVSIDLATYTTAIYTFDHTISVHGTVAKGQHITFVVKKAGVSPPAVYIDGNILYDSSYSTTADVPQFQLLVAGNIYIAGNNTVNELHGVYVAQPVSGAAAGVSGYLHTCATGASLPSSDYATCNSKLTFYGAVSAEHIALERTYGNLATPNDPAESFVFSPELWMSTTGAVVPGSGLSNWQAVTSLPPVL